MIKPIRYVYIILLLSTSLYLIFEGIFPKPILNENSPSPVPATQAHYRKMIFFVIDALRPDMLERMPFVRDILLESRHTLFCVAKADAPTVTLPRLKGLTSGTIPTFRDYFQNFFSDRHTCDNWLTHLRDRGETLVFYGDETWLKMFPEHFDRSDSITSFFISDTLEIDYNVTRHAYQELETSDWDVLILHYLGIDHAGHLYGSRSPLMDSKLEYMDNVVREVIDALPKDTLFVLASDHGMTDLGHHGGSSAQETNSVMLFHSADIENVQPRDPRKINQIDFPTSISFLFHLPIPKNSLGVMIPDLFSQYPLDLQEQYLLSNARHLNSIISNISSPSPQRKQLLSRFPHLATPSEYQHYLYDASQFCSRNLSQLNSLYISLGILLLLLLSIFSFQEVMLFYSKIPGNRPSSIQRIISLLIVFLPLLHILFALEMKICLALSLIVFFFAFFCLPLSLYKHIFSNFFRSIYFDWKVLFSVIGTIMHFACICTSSLVEEEHQLWYFLITTLLLLLFFFSPKQPQQQIHLVCLLLLFLISKKWNQTGDKWMSRENPVRDDIGSFLLSHGKIENLLGIISVYFPALVLFLFKGRKPNILIQLLISSLLMLFKFHHNYMESISLPRIIYFLIFLNTIRRFNFLSMACNFLSVFFLLSKTHNLFLLNLFALQAGLLGHIFANNNNFSSTFGSYLFKSTIALWFAKAAFFMTGNSNSLATIDISNAFVGLSSYQPIPICMHIYLIGYAGPLLFFGASFYNFRNGHSSFFSSVNLFQWFIHSFYLLFLTGLLLHFQSHLFVWSVFSPKFIYEIFHSLHYFVIFSLSFFCK